MYYLKKLQIKNAMGGGTSFTWKKEGDAPLIKEIICSGNKYSSDQLTCLGEQLSGYEMTKKE